MRQRKSLKLYPLTMCYLQERTQKCTKLFFNHYLAKTKITKRADTSHDVSALIYFI